MLSSFRGFFLLYPHSLPYCTDSLWVPWIGCFFVIAKSTCVIIFTVNNLKTSFNLQFLIMTDKPSGILYFIIIYVSFQFGVILKTSVWNMWCIMSRIGRNTSGSSWLVAISSVSSRFLKLLCFILEEHNIIILNRDKRVHLSITYLSLHVFGQLNYVVVL